MKTIVALGIRNLYIVLKAVRGSFSSFFVSTLQQQRLMVIMKLQL